MWGTSGLAPVLERYSGQLPKGYWAKQGTYGPLRVNSRGPSLCILVPQLGSALLSRRLRGVVTVCNIPDLLFPPPDKAPQDQDQDGRGQAEA